MYIGKCNSFLRPIYMSVPFSNQHLYVRVALLNIHTSWSTFVCQSCVTEHTYIILHSSFNTVLHMIWCIKDDSLNTKYRKSLIIIDKGRFFITHHHRRHLRHHYSTLYNILISSSFNIWWHSHYIITIHHNYSSSSLKPILYINYLHALSASSSRKLSIIHSQLNFGLNTLLTL